MEILSTHLRDIRDLEDARNNVESACKILEFIYETQTKTLRDYRGIVVELHHIKFNLLNWTLDQLLHSLRNVSFMHGLIQRYLLGQKYLTWDICCKSMNYRPCFFYTFPRTIRNQEMEILNENLWTANPIDLWFEDIDLCTKMMRVSLTVDFSSRTLRVLGSQVQQECNYRVVSVDTDYVVMDLLLTDVSPPPQSPPPSFNAFYLEEVDLFIELGYVVCKQNPRLIFPSSSAIVEKIEKALVGKAELFRKRSVNYRYLKGVKMCVSFLPSGRKESLEICGEDKKQNTFSFLCKTGKCEGEGQQRGNVVEVCALLNQEYLTDFYHILRFYTTIIDNIETYLVKKEKCLELATSIKDQIREKLVFYGKCVENEKAIKRNPA
jgi:hypothetical protein